MVIGRDGIQEKFVNVIFGLMTISKGERRLKPGIKGRDPGGSTRRSLGPLIVGRSDGLLMGNIGTYTFGNEIPGVIEESIKSDARNVNGPGQEWRGDAWVRFGGVDGKGVVDAKGGLICL
jgi:hypothetical protein